MNPIRIAQIMGNMNSGGVEAVIMNYYRKIDKSKIQFDFFVNKNSSLPQKEEIYSLGGKIYYLPGYKNIFKYMYTLNKKLKKGNYKIVHSNINTLSVFPLIIAYLNKIPIRICHNHSTSGKGEFKRNIIKYILRPFNRIFANYYFACGEYSGRWMFGNNNYKKGKVTIVNNAIQLEKFLYNENIRNEMRKKLKIENKLVIGHVGRFDTQKNHKYLIKIFENIAQKNKNAILLLVGEGDLYDDVVNQVKELNLEKKVKFLGLRNDVNKLFQTMDVFVLPSLYEGLPVVGVEAQASGLGCVFSSRMTKLVKVTKNVEFLNLEDDIEKWSDTILKLANKKRKNTKKEMEKAKFDITKESKKLEKFYLNSYTK